MTPLFTSFYCTKCENAKNSSTQATETVYFLWRPNGVISGYGFKKLDAAYQLQADLAKLLLRRGPNLGFCYQMEIPSPAKWEHDAIYGQTVRLATDIDLKVAQRVY